MKFRYFLIFLATTIIWANQTGDNYYRKLSDNTNLFFNVFRQINALYVDSVAPDKMVKTGLKAMLESLDPYTVLVEGQEKEHFDELSSGNYGGIGIYIGVSGNDKRLTVVTPIDDTPAAKVGLRAGDRIMKIDSLSTDNMDTKQSSTLLRGKAGTKVSLSIQRFGSDKFLEFVLTREKINVINVPYSGILENNIGYIKVTQFASSTVNEIKNAMKPMVESKIKGLIIDLRFNPGGLLNSAVDISSIFLKDSSLVVFTQGNNKYLKKDYLTTKSDLVDYSLPVVVLVNESSASASEILAGALQDFDRAIVVGKTSFGKGLVQQIYPLTDSLALKVTIAKYYTPSGRLIQKRDYFNHTSDKAMVDTLTYFTKNGRKVKSGMGVVPDIEVDANRESDFVIQLKMKNLFSDFAYQYHSQQKDYRYSGLLTDSVISEFKEFIKTNKVDFAIKGEDSLDLLINSVITPKTKEQLKVKIVEIKNILALEKGSLFDNNLAEIKRALELEFAVIAYGARARHEISVKNDNQVAKAIEILSNSTQYNSLLKSSSQVK